MVFHTGAALLDAIVLAVVSMEETGTYGYRITQDVRKVIDVSESTLYPVLRRLQKDECLEVYDRQFEGRNRRYYKVTEKGIAQLDFYREEWKNYTCKISDIFDGADRMNTICSNGQYSFERSKGKLYVREKIKDDRSGKS